MARSSSLRRSSTRSWRRRPSRSASRAGSWARWRRARRCPASIPPMPRTRPATRKPRRDFPMNAPESAMANPLLSRWSGPHGGVPPFDQVKVEHFGPALEAAMQEHLAEIERIAADPAPPTFDNVIAALERAGRTLVRVERVYSVFSSTMRSPAFQDVEREMEPRMAAFRDRIVQNAGIFERISAVYAARAESELTAEEQRLVWLKYTDFARRGARLDPAAKARLSEINQRLAALYTRFSQNVLADE